jgi:glyoxylase-like metal-dependent hydrolase (beta-lactamase superfamily II)/rhodanese-related sulfurtransferase
MWFEQIIRSETGCASYMIGSTKSGECAVLDPLWDVEPYLALAKKHDARIRYVIDSHTHADHVSGARRLTGAGHGELVMPRLADIAYAATRVDHGDRLQLGDVVLEVVHTPGHRPESISLLVIDRSRSEEPWCILTGDFLLVGDLGRPDLAQGGAQGAAMLFDQAIPRLLGLEDYVEVYPGHIAGSTCGRVTSGKTITTVGFERRFNWTLQLRDRSLFIAEMNLDQPERPANVTNIVAINQGRQPLTLEEPEVPLLDAAGLAERLSAGDLLIDMRTPAQFSAGHLPDAYNISLASSSFEQWVGWIMPPAIPLLLLAEQSTEIDLALHKLAFLGLDQRVAWAVTLERTGLTTFHRPLRRLRQINVQSLHGQISQRQSSVQEGRRLHILDVRNQSEWEAGHIDQAHHLSLKELPAQIEALPFAPNDPVALVCASGVRSSLASSILLHHGYREVYNVAGGMNAWREAQLPVVECDAGEGCSIQPRRTVPASSHRDNAPVFTPARDTTNLPYWMEMDVVASSNRAVTDQERRDGKRRLRGYSAVADPLQWHDGVAG